MNYTYLFRDIRNYLAGKAIGITRDKSLLDEIVKCLFCNKFIKESNINWENDEEKISKSYRQTFLIIKNQYQSLFSEDDEILLDPGSISYIHSVLEKIDLDSPKGDPISDLYQTFASTEMRGNEGQFFTPNNAVNWIIDAIDIQKNEKIIDPACGSGAFLYKAAKHLINKKVPKNEISKCLFGIDKDSYLSKLSKTHISLLTGDEPNIFCGDSIEGVLKDSKKLPFKLKNEFDVVVANPPFGAKIKIGSQSARERLDLAKKWKYDSAKNIFIKTEILTKNPSPQILFLEVCLDLLKEGGRLGIVVPESMISNSGTSYVVNYLLNTAQINAVIGMPENLFKTSGKGGTHTKTCLIIATKNSKNLNKKKIFMSEAKWCGNDSRGNSIDKNDLPNILNLYQGKKITRENSSSSKGYFIKQKDIRNFILAPRYYDPKPLEILSQLTKTHDFFKISDLVEKNILEISTGDEVGKLSYGTGDIPFIRTSDISNWEIKIDPKHGISEEIYSQYSKKQDIQENDILMVRDGTYLIGTCALITKYDKKIVYQSHLYKLRIKKPNIISPFVLLAILSSKPVLKQIQSKRFTQDIIDTLGQRINELELPVPKDQKALKKLEYIVKKSIQERVESRELARLAKKAVIELDFDY